MSEESIGLINGTVFKQEMGEDKKLSGRRQGNLRDPPTGKGSHVAFYKRFEDLFQMYLRSGSFDPYLEAALDEGWYMGTVVDILIDPLGEKQPVVLQWQQRSSMDCVEFYIPNNSLATATNLTFLVDRSSSMYTRSDGRKVYVGDRVKVLKDLYDRYMYGIVIEIGAEVYTEDAEQKEMDMTRGRVVFDQGYVSDVMDLELTVPMNPETVGVGHWQWHGSTAARIDIGVALSNNCGSNQINRMKDCENKYKDWIFPVSQPSFVYYWTNNFEKLDLNPHPDDRNEGRKVTIRKEDFVFDLEFLIKHSREDITSAQINYENCHNKIEPSSGWRKTYGTEYAQDDDPCNAGGPTIKGSKIDGTVGGKNAQEAAQRGRTNAERAARRLPAEYDFYVVRDGVFYNRSNGWSGHSNPNRACCVLGGGSMQTHCQEKFSDKYTVSGLFNFQRTLTSMAIGQNECATQMMNHCPRDFETFNSTECIEFMTNTKYEYRQQTLGKYCATADGKLDKGCDCVNQPRALAEDCGQCYRPRSKDDPTLVRDTKDDYWSRYTNSICLFPHVVAEFNKGLEDFKNDSLDLSVEVETAIQASVGLIEIKTVHIVGVAVAIILAVVNLVYMFVPPAKSGNTGRSRTSPTPSNPIIKTMILFVISVTVMLIYFIYTEFTYADLVNIADYAQGNTANYQLADTATNPEPEPPQELVEWEPPKDYLEDKDLEFVDEGFCFNPPPCSQYPGFVSARELLASKDTEDTVPLEYTGKDMLDCCLPMTATSGGRDPNWWDDPRNMWGSMFAELGIGVGTGLALDYLLSKRIYKNLMSGYYPRKVRSMYRTLFRMQGEWSDKIAPNSRKAISARAEKASRLLKKKMNSSRLLVNKLTSEMTRRLPVDKALAKSIRLVHAGTKMSRGSVSSISKIGMGARRHVQRAMFAATQKVTKAYSKMLFTKMVVKVATKGSVAATKLLGFVGGRVASKFIRLAGGPISAIWMIFDIASMIWDMIDDAKLNTFKSNREMLKMRDNIDAAIWEAQGTFRTLPLAVIFPLEWNRAYADFLSEAMHEAIDELCKNEEWAIGYEAAMAGKLADPQYGVEFWDKEITTRTLDIVENMERSDRECTRLLKKHIYHANHEPANVRAFRQCSWWMLARPRLKYAQFGTRWTPGVGVNEAGAVSRNRADITISAVQKRRGLDVIEISGFDSDSDPAKDELKTSVLAIRLENMTEDEMVPVLPNPDMNDSLSLWTAFLFILAEQPGWAFDPTTGDVCDLGEGEAYARPVESKQCPKPKDAPKDSECENACAQDRVVIRSIFRTTGRIDGVPKGMWTVISPRPWHDMEYQLEGHLQSGECRLIENYSFNSGSSGSQAYQGFGLSKIGCDVWNRIHAPFSNDKQPSLLNSFFRAELMAMSLTSVMYTNNYGKKVGTHDNGDPKVEKQFLPMQGFAGLAMVGYGSLILACNGNAQDTRSTGANGTAETREREVVDAYGNTIVTKKRDKNDKSNDFGENRFHLLPEFDPTRRMCTYTDAFCRSYGLDYVLCKEGEGEGACTTNFSKENCEDLARYPDCKLDKTQRVAEMFFGQNMVRRVFKPIGTFMEGKGENFCYDDGDVETCETLGVDPWTLETKCWNETKYNHCELKKCTDFGQPF